MTTHRRPQRYENRGNYCVKNEQNEQGEQKKFLNQYICSLLFVFVRIVRYHYLNIFTAAYKDVRLNILRISPKNINFTKIRIDKINILRYLN
jgi:hypothetical protein